jgi:hypothetical protein
MIAQKLALLLLTSSSLHSHSAARIHRARAGSLPGRTTRHGRNTGIGRRTLHQHVPTEFDNPFDPAAYERRMGSSLRELSKRGLLIALSGNAHSRTEPVPLPSPYGPAGTYAGADLLHVDMREFTASPPKYPAAAR